MKREKAKEVLTCILAIVLMIAVFAGFLWYDLNFKN
jgi:preprotein translocase subunit SecE